MFSFGPQSVIERIGLFFGILGGLVLSGLSIWGMLEAFSLQMTLLVPVGFTGLALLVTTLVKPRVEKPASLAIAFAMIGFPFGGLLSTRLFSSALGNLGWGMIALYILGTIAIHWYAYRKVMNSEQQG